jgi:hypothetical protein
MPHSLSFEKGTHHGNHIARCECGWAHCNSYKATRQHGEWHLEDAGNHPHKWADKDRPYVSRQFAVLKEK